MPSRADLEDEAGVIIERAAEARLEAERGIRRALKHRVDARGEGGEAVAEVEAMAPREIAERARRLGKPGRQA